MQNLIEFQRQSFAEWVKLLDALFPQGLPTRHVWHDQSTIHAVLNHLATAPQLHYVFLPTSGGLNLSGAKPNGTTGLSELSLGSQTWVCKVASLSFESFGDQKDYQWCYFRIELDALPAASESRPDPSGYYQYLTELAPGQYLPPSVWDNRYEEDSELPDGARFIVRFLKGSLVIFKSPSIYDEIPHSDAAAHEKLSSDAFRERVALLRSEVLAWPHSTTFQRLDAILLHGSDEPEALSFE